MISLTFGEQVKIVLSRKDMTIKRACRRNRSKNREKDVPSESDTAAWQR